MTLLREEVDELRMKMDVAERQLERQKIEKENVSPYKKSTFFAYFVLFRSYMNVHVTFHSLFKNISHYKQ